VLQCVAMCCSVLLHVWCDVFGCVAVCCNMLQCVAVCCGVLQSVAVCCRVLQCGEWMCDVMYLDVWYDLLISVWHDSFIFVTWLIHLGDMAHSSWRHYSFTHVHTNCNQMCVHLSSAVADHQDAATYYGVATISRLLKITGLICKRAL